MIVICGANAVNGPDPVRRFFNTIVSQHVGSDGALCDPQIAARCLYLVRGVGLGRGVDRGCGVGAGVGAGPTDLRIAP
jgi:hypothetical protein